MIEPVESLEITVIVDNVTDNLSSNPAFVETAFAGNWRRGMKWLGGKCLCCAAHGLSCLVTARTLRPRNAPVRHGPRRVSVPSAVGKRFVL